MRPLTFALALFAAGCAAPPITSKSVLKEVVTVTTTGTNDGVGVRVVREERALHSVRERVEIVGGE